MEGKLYLGIIYGSYFLSMVIISFLINGLFLKFVSTLGIRNTADTVIRWSTTSKPSLGGISFFLIFLISITSYSVFFDNQQGVFNKQLLGLLSSCTLSFMLGLSDDAYNTKPIFKFFIQMCCAFILISTGTYISLFSNIYLNYFLSAIWIVGMMNSINMLDNMDAITTIVSIFIILSALFLLFINNDGANINIILLIGVLAALIGFLFFNWHPSKMFMGDTGSQFLGLFLAAIGIMFFWNSPDFHKEMIQTKRFFVTILTFAIPIIDTTAVVINRLKKKKSPFIGGKDHTTHSLFYMGLTEKRIAILYAGICLVSMFFNFLIIRHIENWGPIHILLFSIYFLTLFWFLYAPTLEKQN